MARGRPIQGVDLVDGLNGPRILKQRTKIVLGTLIGTVTIAQACAKLGISRPRLYALRRRLLAGAVNALKPRRRGRPTQRIDSPEIQVLRARIDELETALTTTALQSRIALAMSSPLGPAKREGRNRQKTR
mgnify:CR=1 FL=1